jgi:two-component system chemotaxis sensor kinase CheA
VKVIHALLLGCGTLVGVAAATGGFTLRTVDQTNGAINEDVTLQLAAADYERGAAKIRLAAEMRALGAAGSEPLRREGVKGMADARTRLAGLTDSPTLRTQLAEMARVEKLTTDATDALFKGGGAAAKVDPMVAQRLNFVEARAEALGIGLATFTERRREEVEGSLATMRETEVIVGGAILGGLGLSVIVALLLARRFNAPLRKLARGVSELRGGRYEHTIDVTSRDEFGDLAGGFNAMTASLRATMGRLEQRTRDMSRVLDNVAQGLVTIDASGVMSPERSAAITAWFGPAAEGQTLWDYLADVDDHAAVGFKMGWEMLLEDVLPLELAVDQLPKKLVSEGQTFELGYRTITEDDKVVGLLVVVTDVTERIKAEVDHEEQRVFVTMVEQLLRDRASVVDFLKEAESLVRDLTANRPSTPELLKRQLHTLKGNTAIYGLRPVAALCHRLEDGLAERGDVALTADEKTELGATWKYWVERLSVFLGNGDATALAMNAGEYEEFLAAVIKDVPRAQLAEMLARLKLEHARSRLARLGDQAKGLAARLGKAPLEIAIEDHAVRVPREEWQGFWGSLIHVVRNAVDHGVETASERAAAGKPDGGRLVLRTTQVEREVVVEIVDDGHGIDWARVAKKDEVTEISGRGVGLAAARVECERLGGRVRIESTTGRGTTFQFRLPAPELVSIEPRLSGIRLAS